MLRRLFAIAAVLCGFSCTDSAESDTPAEPTAAATRDREAGSASQPTPSPPLDQDSTERDYEDATRGALPGDELRGFASQELAGVARTRVLEQAFSVAAAYALDDGGYLNLDIQNTFHRGAGSDLHEELARSCRTIEEVEGHDACARVEEGRASLTWYLPDRLTVSLAGPGETLVRTAARDLPLDELAELSVKR